MALACMQALYSGNLGADNEQELRVLCSEVQSALALGSARIRVSSQCLSSHGMYMWLVLRASQDLHACWGTVPIHRWQSEGDAK